MARNRLLDIRFVRTAIVTGVLLTLCACGTPDEAELVEEAGEVPAAATAATLLDDPAAFDPEIGRPAFEAAMRVQCPDAGVAGAECRATDDPTRFACQYELIDDTRNERREATIVREGEEWVLAAMPAHCSADELEVDPAG